MATAQEARPQSIQERIAALNQSHVGRIPGASPSSQPPPKPARPAARPPLPPRNSTSNSTANGSHGSVASSGQRELLPPPMITRTGQKTSTNTATEKPKRPPPLPSRKASLPPPTLPSRSSSDFPARKNSGDSSFSINSVSTSSTAEKSPSTRSTSIEPTTNRIRAPAWNDAAPPPLPQRSDSTPAPPKVRVRRLSNGLMEVPTLEARSSEESGRSPQRKLPPVPSSDALQKIKSSSFAALNIRDNEDQQPCNGIQHGQQQDGGNPPPVPLASRPNLSKRDSSRTRSFQPAPAPPPQDPSTVCMTCRDFSGPDTHAARYSRQTLPTHDLKWLATELTASFPSLTDKARAIFTWLHHNVDYDVYSFFNKCVGPQTPENTFNTGLAVCAGYAGLFETLAKHAGLEVKVINGHGKGYGYSPLPEGSPIPAFNSNHAWNAVRIDGGQWKLIDACWGAGSIACDGQSYNRHFSPDKFTMSNYEFTIRHFPTEESNFYSDEGINCMPYMTWEEYMRIDPTQLGGVEPPTVFTGSEENHGIGKRTLEPAGKAISIHQSGPLRFQFGLMCEHWTLNKHSKKSAPYVFILILHGVDGRKKEYVAFERVRGTGPGGGGDLWYADVKDPKKLGAPGQRLMLYIVKSFGKMQDARGLTKREFLEGVNRTAMGFEAVAEWSLVA